MRRNTFVRSNSVSHWFSAVFGLALLVFFGHVLYVLHSRQYPQWDEHNYLSLAIKYADILKTPSWDTWGRMLDVTGYLQPVYSLTIALFLLILGTEYTYAIALLLNGVFFAASAAGVVALSRVLFDRKTALVAGIVFAGLGNALFYSHFAYTETAVTAFLIWSLVCLVRSDHFSHRAFSIAAGGLAALAILTRWIAVVFIAGPLLVELAVWVFLVRKGTSKVSLSAPVYFALPALVPIVVYFIPNWTEFAAYVARNQQNGREWVSVYRFAEMANTFSTRSIMYYFNILSQNTVYIFSLFVAGCVLSLMKIKKMGSILTAFLLPYAFLTFVAVWKEDRFLVPLYPVFAVITASSVYFVWRAGKLLIASLLVLVSLFTYLGGAWGVGPLGRRGLADIVLPAYIHHPRRIYLTPIVWPPTREYLNAHLVTRVIRATTTPGYMPVVVGQFSFEPLENAFLSITEYHQRDLMNYKKAPYDIQQADFVITKSNDSLSYIFEKDEARQQYQLIAIIPIPMDNSTVSVYKHEN